MNTQSKYINRFRFFVAAFLQFLLFLLQPEDTSEIRPPGKAEKSARFDGRIFGAIKIFFWIGVVALVSAGLPVMIKIIAS
jgi:hypothetical protein